MLSKRSFRYRFPFTRFVFPKRQVAWPRHLRTCDFGVWMIAPVRTQSRNCWFLQHPPARDQICIMRFRLDYICSRRVFSNFPMSHIYGRKCFRKIDTRANPIMYRTAGEKERDRAWCLGRDRSNNNSAGQWSGISIRTCIRVYFHRGVTNRIVVIVCILYYIIHCTRNPKKAGEVNSWMFIR